MSVRPRRRLDAIRRPHILATTVELLREKGLWSVRLADVAKRAEISPAGVVYYFGSKDQLFAQAIADTDDAFYDAVLPELAALERATDRMAWLVVRSSRSEWLLWIDLWVYSRRHPETETAQRRFQRRWRDAIADVIRYGRDTGEFGGADTDEVALRLAALTDGLAVHMVLGDSEHTHEAYIEMTLRAAALELRCDLGELRRAAARCELEVAQAA